MEIICAEHVDDILPQALTKAPKPKAKAGSKSGSTKKKTATKKATASNQPAAQTH
jgi:hypothetical protein